MIKNVAFKRFLSNTIFTLFSKINSITKHKDSYIMLYSNMGLRDNIGALYEYLIKNEYYKKYKIICSCNDYNKYDIPHHKNIIFTSNLKGIFYFFKCKHIYYCFGKLPIKPAKDQDVIQMWHGTPLKAGDKATKDIDPQKDIYYTHLFSASKHFIPIVSNFFNKFPQDRIVVCGHPRTDILLEKEYKKYDFGPYRKLLTWAPTFRKSETLGYQDSSQTSIVPIFDTRDLIQLNNKLKEYQIKLVIKLHPLQDLSQYNLCEMDYLILLSHTEFVKKKMDLYELLRQSDGLITDYSSVYFDYLLLDRPIGFTADDEQEYGNNRGYAMDNPENYKPGAILKNKEDFYQFLYNFANEKDAYKEERKRVKKLSNDFCDGKNSQRALEISRIFI